MWRIVVVDPHEAIELRLLLEEVFGGRFGRFLLQGEVHPLMPAVLRGVPGLRMGRHAVLIEGRTAKPDDLDLFRDEADVAFFAFRAGQGTAQEAERRLRLLIDRDRAALGPANARTLSSIDRLGVLLAHENRVEEEVALLRAAVAEEILHESLDLNRRLRGESSPRVAQAEYNLACLFARRGENSAAIEMLETSVAHGLSPDATLQMESDTDLIGLKDEPRCKALTAKVTKAE